MSRQVICSLLPYENVESKTMNLGQRGFEILDRLKKKCEVTEL